MEGTRVFAVIAWRLNPPPPPEPTLCVKPWVRCAVLCCAAKCTSIIKIMVPRTEQHGEPQRHADARPSAPPVRFRLPWLSFSRVLAGRNWEVISVPYAAEFTDAACTRPDQCFRGGERSGPKGAGHCPLAQGPDRRRNCTGSAGHGMSDGGKNVIGPE